MKALFAITVVLAISFTGTIHAQAVVDDDLKMLVRPILIQCAKDLCISQEDLDAVINNDLSNTTTPLQCLPLCFFGAIGIMDTEGNLDVSHSIRLFSAGADACMVNRIVKKCSTVKGVTACNTAFLINKCFVDEGLL